MSAPARRGARAAWAKMHVDAELQITELEGSITLYHWTGTTTKIRDRAMNEIWRPTDTSQEGGASVAGPGHEAVTAEYGVDAAGERLGEALEALGANRR